MIFMHTCAIFPWPGYNWFAIEIDPVEDMPLE